MSERFRPIVEMVAGIELMLIVGVIASTMSYLIAASMSPWFRFLGLPYKILAGVIGLSACAYLIFWLIRAKSDLRERASIRLRLTEHDVDRLLHISYRIAKVVKKVNRQLRKSDLKWLKALLGEVDNAATACKDRLTKDSAKELATTIANLRKALHEHRQKIAQKTELYSGKSATHKNVKQMRRAAKRTLALRNKLERVLREASYIEALMDTFRELKGIRYRESIEKLFGFQPDIFCRRARIHLNNSLDDVSFQRLSRHLKLAQESITEAISVDRSDQNNSPKSKDRVDHSELAEDAIKALREVVRDLTYRVDQNKEIEDHLTRVIGEQTSIWQNRSLLSSILQIVQERSTGKAVDKLGKTLIRQGETWGESHEFLVSRANCRPGFSIPDLLDVESYTFKATVGEREIEKLREPEMREFLENRGERVRNIWKNCGHLFKCLGMITANGKTVKTVLTFGYSTIVRDVLKMSVDELLLDPKNPESFVYSAGNPLEVYIIRDDKAPDGEDRVMKDAMDEVLARRGCLKCSIISPEIAMANFEDFKIDVILLGFECVTKDGWFLHPGGRGELIEKICNAIRGQGKDEKPVVIAVGEGYKVRESVRLYKQDTACLDFCNPLQIDYIVTDCGKFPKWDSGSDALDLKSHCASDRHALKERAKAGKVDLSCCIPGRSSRSWASAL